MLLAAACSMARAAPVDVVGDVEHEARGQPLAAVPLVGGDSTDLGPAGGPQALQPPLNHTAPATSTAHTQEAGEGVRRVFLRSLWMRACCQMNSPEAVRTGITTNAITGWRLPASDEGA